jgi:hypothetical protein
VIYIIRFSLPGGAKLYADWDDEKLAWLVVSKEISARRFKSKRVAERVARNVPSFKQMVADGCSWAMVERTPEMV